MTSRCVEKLPHKTATCDSKSGLQVFLKEDGTYDGFCFSCGTYVKDPYSDKPEGYAPAPSPAKTKEAIQAELDEIGTYQIMALPTRGLKKEYLKYYDVKVGVSEADGQTPEIVYFPYYKQGELTGYKVRLLPQKKMWATGSTRDTDLFGWDKAKRTGAKRLYITEGEYDAVALFQVFKEKNKGTPYADANPAIVSLPCGSGGAARAIKRQLDEIKGLFKEVALVFDMDEAGKEAVEEVLKILPDALVVTLPEKDPNDCVLKGMGVACYNACQFNAKKPKNTRLVAGSSLHDSARKQAELGVSWPWKHLTKATRGIRLGETIYIGAGQKQGKSEVVNTLAAHFIKEHDWKVFLVKPEEANNKTYKLVAGKLAGKVFHDPDIQFDEAAYDSAGKLIKDKLFMLNLYQHIGWDTLKADIRSAASEGCKVIIIDPITNLINGLEPSSANTKLQEIAQELSSMALDLNVVIFIFCHLRNPDSGTPHERGGEVLSSQFAGSRAMARSCNLMLGIEGNRDPNLSDEEKNIRTIVLLEDREYGQTGRYKLFWDRNTGLFNEIA